ncbi:MAG: NYN domain-containing protein [Cyanobacteria bacterium REEB459]|nr:NYN domain-containing protein [Cyanobacteria bacterium REEB459]
MESNDYLAQLLVDGYNMIGAWPTLVRVRQRHGFEAARQELIELLVNYSARKGLDTQLIFDAYSVRSPQNQEMITPNLSVCYTAFGQTADSYIERVCAQLRQSARGKYRVIVATSDRSHQLTVVGYGAEWMSARQLQGDIDVTQRQAISSSHRRLQPQSLLSHLNQETREKLMRLRSG